MATILALLWPSGSWAETLSNDCYRLKIHPDAKITERVDTGWETMMTVELAGERARVRWKSDGFTVIFPNATLRAQLGANATSTAYELTTDFEGKRYKVARSPREVSWNLPGQEVFFRTFGGKISKVLGTSDFLNITRDTRGGRISLESQAGTSDVLLRKGALEVFDGPEVQAHLYFVRGLAFQRGPITFEVPLPKEPFLDALPADRFLVVPSTQSKPTEPEEESAIVQPEDIPEGNPLEAEPPTWASPVYRSNQGDRKDDPLNARREVRASAQDRPLDAKTAPNSEEILRVQDY
jgi:hypothetical protein